MQRSRLPGFFALACLTTGCDSGSAPPDGVEAVFGHVGLSEGGFVYPRGIAAETSGSVFVVDKVGRVQRFTPAGKFEIGWTMPDTEFGKPVGMAVHPDGRLFIADTHYHRVMIYDRNGKPLDSFGEAGTDDGQFQLPTDVAFDADGFIYVGEYHLNDRITKWTPDLKFVQAFGEEPIEGRRLSRPAGLDVDEEGTLWVADSCNHRLVRFKTDGTVLRTFGAFGAGPGEMRYPYDVSVAPDGTLMVCEYEGCRLQWFTKEGRSLRTWGRHGRKRGELFQPWGAVYGPLGRLYIVDSLNSRVQVVQP